MAPAKTKLQREQKLWELQRPPVGPINTYQCLPKQSFNAGYSAEMGALASPQKIAILSQKTGLGGGERKYCAGF